MTGWLKAATLVGLAAATLAAAPLTAQPDDCSDGVFHDDGTFEASYGAVTDLVHYVMRIDPPSAPAELTSLCLCWTRTGGNDEIEIDVAVWAADGPDGGPGTALGRLEAQAASGVPPAPAQAFFRYDLTVLEITVSGPIYVGPKWESDENPGFELCADENGPTSRPAFVDTSELAAEVPPAEEVAAARPDYRNLGIRAVFTELPGVRLSDLGGLVVPGLDVDVDDPSGPTTLISARNITPDETAIEVTYHADEVTETFLRQDVLALGGNQTWTRNVRDDLAGLDPDGDGRASGLVAIRESGGDASNLVGDYLRVDSGNDFATGGRLVRSADFCRRREVRFLDFGSGSELTVLVELPRGDEVASFSYAVLDQQGQILEENDFMTSSHLNVIDVADLVSGGQRFGTLVFDFSKSGGGWVSARYSAFGRFSVEIDSACRNE